MEFRNDIWDNMIERYEMLYPGYAERTVHWYPSGHRELSFLLEDGEVVVYDDATNQAYIARSDDTDNNIEDENIWRAKFAYKLRNRMSLCGIDRECLSMLTEIPVTTISRYTNAKTTPTTFNLLKIARALNCSPNELTYHRN